MNKRIIGMLLALLALLLAPPLQASWSLVNEASLITFVSIKKNSVAEVGHFKQVAGTIGDDGKVEMKIDLASVDTGIEVRDQRKRVFDLVKDFGTSESPKSTRSSTTHWCPGRPGHPAFRHNIASSLRLHTGLPYDWTPRSDAPLGSPLAPSARRVSRVASRLPGTTRLRFALHGGQRRNRACRRCCTAWTPTASTWCSWKATSTPPCPRSSCIGETRENRCSIPTTATSSPWPRTGPWRPRCTSSTSTARNRSPPSSLNTPTDTGIHHMLTDTIRTASSCAQASLRSRERFWDIRVPKIDSIFDNSLVPRPSWSPGVPPQHRKLVAATHRSPI